MIEVGKYLGVDADASPKPEPIISVIALPFSFLLRSVLHVANNTSQVVDEAFYPPVFTLNCFQP
jgi:hypothetical protein